MTIDEAKNLKKVAENTDYIVQLVNIVAKTLVEAFENLKIEDINMFQLGYNKAIDDFVKEICKMIVQSENNGNYRFYAVEIKQAIADLAEQLKAGGENEQSI